MKQKIPKTLQVIIVCSS